MTGDLQLCDRLVDNVILIWCQQFQLDELFMNSHQMCQFQGWDNELIVLLDKDIGFVKNS